jgi:hypothetical protein
MLPSAFQCFHRERPVNRSAASLYLCSRNSSQPEVVRAFLLSSFEVVISRDFLRAASDPWLIAVRATTNPRRVSLEGRPCKASCKALNSLEYQRS